MVVGYTLDSSFFSQIVLDMILVCILVVFSSCGFVPFFRFVFLDSQLFSGSPLMSFSFVFESDCITSFGFVLWDEFLLYLQFVPRFD